MKADVILINIGSLYAMDGPSGPWRKDDIEKICPITNGHVAIKGDKILSYGDTPVPLDVDFDKYTNILDCSGKTVVPGFIDSHTHLVHGGSRENELDMKLKGVEYLDILKQGGGILSTVRATKEASETELFEKAAKSLQIMMSYGTTTVEAKSGYGLDDFETEIKQLKVARELNQRHMVDVVSTFMPAHAVPPAYKENPEGYIDLMIEEYLPEVKERNLAEFLDVFCEEGVFSVEESRKILIAGEKLGYKLKVHADEIVPLGGAELAAEVGAITAEHLLAASDQGIEDMAKAGVIANLLPATSFNLQKNIHARARKMIDSGVPVAISTDYNPGSSPTENIQLAMQMASLSLKMTPEEVLTAVTVNGASAIGRQDQIGSITPGKKADLVCLDVSNIQYMIYHFGINHTCFVVKSGKVFSM